MLSKPLGLAALLSNLQGAVQREVDGISNYDLVREERIAEFDKKLSGKGRLTKRQIATLTDRNLSAVVSLMKGYVRDGYAVEYIVGKYQENKSKRVYEWIPKEKRDERSAKSNSSEEALEQGDEPIR